MEQTRADLKLKFSDGKRPSGADFSDLLESFVNPKDDNLKKDSNGNFVVTLGAAPDAPTPAAGTLRFSAGKVQFSTGAAWQDVGATSGGGFQPVAGTTNLAYNGGNIGIGTGATQPSAKFEVSLGVGEQIKVGNLLMGNSAPPLNNFVQLSHATRNNATDVALRQGPNGDVTLNCPIGQKLTLARGGNQARLTILDNGAVVAGAATEITNNVAPTSTMQVNGDLFVTGQPLRNGGGAWIQPSDIRLKQDIRPFVDGLAELLRIKPVRFRYNGQAQTPTEPEQIGILGQEIAEVLPYTVSASKAKLEPDQDFTDILIFDPNALTYVLINAVKELAARVKELERQINE